MNFVPAKQSTGSDFPGCILEGLQVVGLGDKEIALILIVLAVLAISLIVNRRGTVSNKFRKYKRLPREKAAKFRTNAKESYVERYLANDTNMADPSDQLRAIARFQFERTRLLNREEAHLLPVLEGAAHKVGPGHRVLAQTSLGEIIRPKQGTGNQSELKNAFASINSKRLDFAVVDRRGLLVCAVEYQGSGHHQGTAFMRDAVKKEVLRRADVPLVEVYKDFNRGEVQNLIERILIPDGAASQHGHTAVHM